VESVVSVKINNRPQFFAFADLHINLFRHGGFEEKKRSILSLAEDGSCPLRSDDNRKDSGSDGALTIYNNSNTKVWTRWTLWKTTKIETDYNQELSQLIRELSGYQELTGADRRAEQEL